MNPELHKHAETIADEIMRTILDPAGLTTASKEPGPNLTMETLMECIKKMDAAPRRRAVGIVCHSRHYATVVAERDAAYKPDSIAPLLPIYRDDDQEQPILAFYDNEHLRAHLQRKEIWQEVIEMARDAKMFLPTAVDRMRKGPDSCIIPSISRAEAERLFPKEPAAYLMVAFNFIR